MRVEHSRVKKGHALIQKHKQNMNTWNSSTYVVFAVTRREYPILLPNNTPEGHYTPGVFPLCMPHPCGALRLPHLNGIQRKLGTHKVYAGVTNKACMHAGEKEATYFNLPAIVALKTKNMHNPK